MDIISYALDPSLVAAILVALMLVGWRIGVQRGRSLHNRNGTAPQFDSAGMAFMGLLLAFAFGISMSKFDQRRLALVEDSNAIGDFYTCATLLKEPIRSRLQGVIRGYAEERLRLARLPSGSFDFENALQEFEQTHREMTILVDQGLAAGTPIAVSLTNALNAVTSNHAARLAAIKDRLPGSVMALLLISTITTAILIGRCEGYTGAADIDGMILFAILICSAIYVTLDLNRPEVGFIKVSQEPIERLVSSMQH